MQFFVFKYIMAENNFVSWRVTSAEEQSGINWLGVPFG